DHESKVTLLGMQVTAPIPKITDKAPNVRVPVDVENIIRKLLAKEAGHRVNDAKEFLDAIGTVTAMLVNAGIIPPPTLPAPMSMPRASMPTAPKLLSTEASGSYPSLSGVPMSVPHTGVPGMPAVVSGVGSGARINFRLLLAGAGALAVLVVVVVVATM